MRCAASSASGPSGPAGSSIIGRRRRTFPFPFPPLLPGADGEATDDGDGEPVDVRRTGSSSSSSSSAAAALAAGADVDASSPGVESSPGRGGRDAVPARFFLLFLLRVGRRQRRPRPRRLQRLVQIPLQRRLLSSRPLQVRRELRVSREQKVHLFRQRSLELAADALVRPASPLQLPSHRADFLLKIAAFPAQRAERGDEFRESSVLLLLLSEGRSIQANVGVEFKGVSWS